MRTPDIVGKKFNRLLVLGLYSNGRRTEASVRCDCGKELTVAAYKVRSGHTRSCGCLKIEELITRRKTHGLSSSPGYDAWALMIRRCTNPRSDAYPNYGGRGIRVCERWLSFDNFLADMGERPPGKTLDRYPDNNGNYEPSNCRWATSMEQNNNTRRNRLIEYNGRCQTIGAWATELGVHRNTLTARIERGEPLQHAMSQKKFKSGRGSTNYARTRN